MEEGGEGQSFEGVQSEYPLVNIQEAVAMQNSLREEAIQFLAQTNPAYIPALREGSINAAVQYFPEEHTDEVARKRAFGAVAAVETELLHIRQGTSHYQQFGVKEALARVTEFGHDDIKKYSLRNVVGASKRQVLAVNIKKDGWTGYEKDVFAANKLLTQAEAGTQR